MPSLTARQLGINHLRQILARRLSLAVVIIAAAWSAGSSPAARTAVVCPEPRASAGYTTRVLGALRSGRDVWGEELLAHGGASYAAARRYLAPLFLARGRGGPLTTSGTHYVPFAMPLGARGAGSVALHVADGSEIDAERVEGRRLTIWVGRGGRERYGSCVSRLATPRLADGWLPILQTAYRDATGARYRQESFSARTGGSATLTSFLKLSVDPPGTRVTLRLAGHGRTLVLGASPAFVAWPSRGSPRPTDEATYEDARRSVVAYWQQRLAEEPMFDVPERRVLDAERALLLQNLALTWRYSIGNPYEEFSFPESVNNAEIAAEYGQDAVAQSILRTSLTRRPVPYPNWKMGQRLLGFAVHYRLYRDRAFVAQATPALRRYVAALGAQIERGRGGLLGRERYSSDIPDQVYGLHAQAVVWQALRESAAMWAETGQTALARRCRALADRLGAGLRTAVRASARRLPDGSLFVPVNLLDGEQPYENLTASRAGSYWNLVMPYALASGLFSPGGRDARGIWRYMQTHGSRLLGLVRASAFALYKTPEFPESGTDQVYGLNVSRFLADNDDAEQLVLSLYGQLAAGMTPGTFVAGEGATVAPLDGAWYRSMYLPPNSTSNGAFLETLRLMLVHEIRDRDGEPHGLELAYATPRTWLSPGKTIAVRDAPTSFGPLSYSLEAAPGSVRATVEVPARAAPKTLRLRLRLPARARITHLALDGRSFNRLNHTTGTIDLSGLKGTLTLDAQYATP
jgi:hypothetical protein